MKIIILFYYLCLNITLNMKKIYLLFVLFVFGLNIKAQQIFSTSGKVITNGSVNLSYTIGEPLVSLNKEGDIILSNGFQNALIAKITKVKNNLFKPSELLVYPNPSSGILNIENRTTKSNLNVNIYSLQGQQVFNKQYKELILEQINLSNLADALYILSIEDESNKINTYKIQLIK